MSMKQVPQVINAEWLRQTDCEAYMGPAGWVAARPMSMGWIGTRLNLAWKVFTGKYDALQWGGGQ